MRSIRTIALITIALVLSYFVYQQCNKTEVVHVEEPDIVVREGRDVFDSDNVSVTTEDEDGELVTTTVEIEDGRDVIEVISIDSTQIAIMRPRGGFFPDFSRGKSNVLEMGTGDTTRTVISTLQRRPLISFRPGFSAGIAFDSNFYFYPSAAVSVGRIGPFRPGLQVAYSREELLWGPEVSTQLLPNLDIALGTHVNGAKGNVSLKYRF